ncbi:MAG: M48 family metallopeptidase [Magnetococcales bacterium]|nr:M48 family metallopeptidase [Magnetococcales bacterium]MBF0321602.1 M48 family metallopeptidase [Magnetococcales bacterium]
MNTYGWIILTTLIAGFIVDSIAHMLNLRSLHQGVPEGFATEVPHAQYHRHQEYVRAQTRLHLAQSTWDLLLLLGFWLVHGFFWLDATVHNLGWGPTASGLLYIGILLLANRLLSLPFSLYATFVLETRFGFNRTTLGTWLTDLIKGTLLTVVIGGPILAGVLLLFTRFGPHIWPGVWGMIAGFMLLMQLVAPTMIMPLFNRFSPLPEGDLRTTLLDYTRRVGFPVAGIAVMDGSRRSTKANAFFTGFGKFRRIVLFDTLVKEFAPAELRAILAHEVGHWRQHHLLKLLLLNLLNLAIMLYLLSLCLTLPELFHAFYVAAPSVHAGLIFFVLLFTPVEMVLSTLLKWRSRQHEFAADHFAAQTCGDGSALVRALKKLAKDHLAHMTPHPLYVLLNHSHPPLIERVGKIRLAMGPTGHAG